MINKQMMQQMQQMQKRMQSMQEELGNATVQGTAGGGAVTCEVSGHQELKAITISQDAVDPDDVETLQDLVLAAVNDGLKKSQELAQQKMSALTGGLKIPGLM
ncbi:MAG TPA: YbaB/EbfC family nucleoid-associated protein [Chloroflexota bacterium]|nr:YbaB/EbfC family nucleoid-associated protein [Chloroflexota bacterium]